MGLEQAALERARHPIDVIEQLSLANKWSFERANADELSVLVQGAWTSFSISFSWMEECETLHVSCAFDMRVAQNRLMETLRLMSLVNSQMILGHFDLQSARGPILFRHALPLAGGAGAGEQQIECLLTHALTACERYFPAFQFVVWGGRKANDALDNALFDTVGEA